jgi:hypothetical protein
MWQIAGIPIFPSYIWYNIPIIWYICVYNYIYIIIYFPSYFPSYVEIMGTFFLVKINSSERCDQHWHGDGLGWILCQELSSWILREKSIQMGVEKKIQIYHIITCIECVYIYRSILRYICILYYRHMINSFMHPIPCHVPITSMVEFFA